MENKEVLSVKAAELDEFLDGLKGTKPNAPYKLNIEGFTRESVDVLRKHPKIYVDLRETKIGEDETNGSNGRFYFKECSTLVVPPQIPDGVKDISGFFDNCKNLVQAPIIPDGVTDMNHCFSGCSRLEAAPEIPNSVINMYGSFEDCEWLRITPVIPDSVKNMAWCFKGCTSIFSHITIPRNVKNIMGCFLGCKFLQEITIFYNQGCSYDQFISYNYNGCVTTDYPRAFLFILIKRCDFYPGHAFDVIQPIEDNTNEN